MKIALIGATGTVGSRLTAELLSRQHHVTAIARNPEKMAIKPGLTTAQANVSAETRELTAVLARHDAVIVAVPFSQLKLHLDKLLSAIKKSGGKRVLFVGGAGSLEIAPGVQLVDTPDFPAPYKMEALAGRDVLNALRTETDLNWSFLSPSAVMLPGIRTGKFRIGKDQLLSDANGDSKISTEDLAVALVDELEKPAHSRQRFTVGY